MSSRKCLIKSELTFSGRRGRKPQHDRTEIRRTHDKKKCIEENAVDMLKNGKAAGKDAIVAERRRKRTNDTVKMASR